MAIAFCARSQGHTSYGNDDLIEFQTTITNEGNHWDGTDFTVPQGGVYLLSVTFVKDSYYYGGTTDDVSVGIYVNDTLKGRAWSGEGAGQRGTGAVALTLVLNAGDKVRAKAGSDGGPMRHIAECYFTGFLVA